MVEKMFHNSCQRKRKNWEILVSVMAAIVVFCTTYALILPAITQERESYCGYERHSHGEECYMHILICDITENEADSEILYHVHDENCYKESVNLTCPLSESEGHFHSEECLKTESICICTLEENEEHVHEDSCYETQEMIVCGQEEMEPHIHDENCFETMNQLICEQEEIPPPEKHVHTENCYENKLVCGMEEHDHNLQCYSDKNADVESEEEWTKDLPKELSGIWAEDLLETAKSQLGYRESTKNYEVVNEDETKGYTRYGDWYGDPYGDWCAMFVSFCLHYADIPENAIGYESNCQDWVELLKTKELPIELEENKLEQPLDSEIVLETENKDNLDKVEQPKDESGMFQYQLSGEYIPKPGDLVFFEVSKEDWANHVGIVKDVRIEVEDKEGNLISEVDTIEGNASDAVKEKTYSLDDKKILGYGILPENPNSMDLMTEMTEDLTTTETSEEMSTEMTEDLTSTETSEEISTEMTEDLTSTETKEETEIQAMTEYVSVEARWLNDNEEERPDFVQVQLYQNDTKYGDIVELSSENGWFYQWSDLPSKNSDGYEYEYYVEETPVSGYSSEQKLVEETKEQDDYTEEGGQENTEPETESDSPHNQYIVITYTKIANQYVLPETGGIGTHVFTAGGAVLIIGSLLTGCMIIRKRERRIKKSLPRR